MTVNTYLKPEQRTMFEHGLCYAKKIAGSTVDISEIAKLDDANLVAAYILAEEEAVAKLSADDKPIQLRTDDQLVSDKQRVDLQNLNIDGGFGISISPIDEMNFLNYRELLDIRRRLMGLFKGYSAVDWEHLLVRMCEDDRIGIPYPHGVHPVDYSIRLAIRRNLDQFIFTKGAQQIEKLRASGRADLEALLMKINDMIDRSFALVDAEIDAKTAAKQVADLYNNSASRLSQNESILERPVEYIEGGNGDEVTFELKSAELIFSWIKAGLPQEVLNIIDCEVDDIQSAMTDLDNSHDDFNSIYDAMTRIKMNKIKPITADYLSSEYAKLPFEYKKYKPGKGSEADAGSEAEVITRNLKIAPLDRFASNTVKIENIIQKIKSYSGEIICSWKSSSAVSRLLDVRYAYLKQENISANAELSLLEILRRDINEVLMLNCVTDWQVKQAALNATALLQCSNRFLQSLASRSASNYHIAELREELLQLENIKTASDTENEYATFAPVLMSDAYGRLKPAGSTLRALNELGTANEVDVANYKSVVSGWYANQERLGDPAYAT